MYYILSKFRTARPATHPYIQKISAFSEQVEETLQVKHLTETYQMHNNKFVLWALFNKCYVCCTNGRAERCDVMDTPVRLRSVAVFSLSSVLFSKGLSTDVFPPAATVVTSVSSNICHVFCFWRRRQGTWPSYLENWGEFRIFGSFCFQLEASLYRPDCYRVTTDLRHHLFAGIWFLNSLGGTDLSDLQGTYKRIMDFKICYKLSLWKAWLKLYL
jgi:hypothetical protein